MWIVGLGNGFVIWEISAGMGQYLYENITRKSSFRRVVVHRPKTT